MASVCSKLFLCLARMFTEIFFAVCSNKSAFSFIPNVLASLCQKTCSQWLFASLSCFRICAEKVCIRSTHNLSFHDSHAVLESDGKKFSQGTNVSCSCNFLYRCNMILGTRLCNSSVGNEIELLISLS